MTDPGKPGGAPWQKGSKPMEGCGSTIEDRTELQERRETEGTDGEKDVVAA